MLFYLTDFPRQFWLQKDEIAWLETVKATEKRNKEKVEHLSLFQALTDTRILLCALVYFCLNAASYGVAFFLPTIIKNFGVSDTQTGLLAALPFVFGGIGMVLLGQHSDWTVERKGHVAVALLMAAIGIGLSGLVLNPIIVMALLCFAQIGVSAVPAMFWPLPASFLTGASAAAGIAAINSLGNLSGFAGPFAMGYLKDLTGNFTVGLLLLAGCAVIGAAVVVSLRIDAKREQPSGQWRWHIVRIKPFTAIWPQSCLPRLAAWSIENLALARCERRAVAHGTMTDGYVRHCGTTPAQVLKIGLTREGDLKLSFHGADRSRHPAPVIWSNVLGRRILIDCGLYQGSRELDEENAEPFGFDAASIDYVLLTHAHLDHCGRLPYWPREGFGARSSLRQPRVNWRDLSCLDAAHLQEEDVRRRAGRSVTTEQAKTITEPLYSTLDALNCLDYFGRTAAYAQVLEVAAGVHATFIDAGHILGSASIFLELEEQSHSTSVLFSGDLGNAGRLLLRSPATPPRAENVVMETTYGDRLHKPLGPSIDEFYEAITETFKRGGNVIIPTFALERAQELIYFLGQGIAQGRLTKSTQVYLDSPMAISATEIFRRHPECFEPATAKLFEDGARPA